MPDVKRVQSAVIAQPYALGPSGAPNRTALAGGSSAMVASVDGLFFDQDRPAVLEGRMSDPASPDEVVMTQNAATAAHVHVGSTMALGFYSAAEQQAKGFGTSLVQPYLTVHARVVGLVALSQNVIEDDIDRSSWVIFTPALARTLIAPPLVGNLGWTVYGLQLDHGNADVPLVEREISNTLAKGTDPLFHEASMTEAEAQHAIEPDWIALGVFALICALALLLVALQTISRMLQLRSDDHVVMRALGATPAMIAADELAGVLVALATGVVLAVVVAGALSPFSPVGPVRPVYPDRGFSFDWFVLGLGALGMLVVLVLAAVVLVLGATSQRRVKRAQLVTTRGSVASRLVASLGLATSAVEGVRFALVPGRGRTSVPVRSVMLGATLAVVILITTLTFGASLSTLVSRPALYGWNFTYALNSTFGESTLPPTLQTSLAHDPKVAASTSVVYFNIQLDGRTVPTMFEQDRAPVAPPQLSGHAVRAERQVVLGTATLAALHKHVGQNVVASYQGGSVALTIVGTATFPAVGLSQTLHPTLGVGAVASSDLTNAGLKTDRYCGPPAQLVFVRLRPGVSRVAGLADGVSIVAATNRFFVHASANSNCSNDGFALLNVQRPAVIANYRSMSATPALLSGVLGLAALSALAVTLVASVRRRRRDLAILKTLGFTKRQLSAAVAWQASVTMGVGLAVGVPLGVALGRWLWTLFARAIYVVPVPTVPWGSIWLVTIGAMLFANVVAAVPGRLAAATPTAIVLRAE